MPELAEVEWMVRGLRERAQGCALEALEIRDERLFSKAAGVTGVLQAVERRAKYIRMDFGELTLLLHPRMTGRLVWGLDERARAVFRFRDVDPISFVDPRRFGTLQQVARDEVALFFRDKKLGDEPWPQKRDGGWWSQRLAGRRIPIKTALMRQDLVAGLGNIAAVEICWRMGVNPRTRASDLTPEQWEDLGGAVWDHLGVTLSDIGGALELVGEGGDNGFLIYGRGGEPCPRCGADIERFQQSGRGTYWCSGCQPEGT